MRGFTVYWNPSDYPNRVVVRGWTIEPGTVAVISRLVPDGAPVYVGYTITAARAALLALDPNLVRLERFDEDEPQIVEVWI